MESSADVNFGFCEKLEGDTAHIYELTICARKNSFPKTLKSQFTLQLYEEENYEPGNKRHFSCFGFDNFTNWLYWAKWFFKRC